MSETELKPCPFCGGKAVCIRTITPIYNAYCKQCGAVVSFVGAEEEKDCIKAWNRRVEKDVRHRST